MALPDELGLTELVKQTRIRWVMIRDAANKQSVDLQSSTTAEAILGIRKTVEDQRAFLIAARDRQGIADEAARQWPGYTTIGPDFQAFIAGLNGVLAEVIALGATVVENPDGTKTNPTFQPAQLATLRTRLNELAATVVPKP